MLRGYWKHCQTANRSDGLDGTPVHDIVEFLRRHAPFSDLSEEALEELARSTEVEFFPAGATIFRQEVGPIQHLRVIRRGGVELVDRGRVLDLLGEGDLFGHPSMLSGLPTGFEARAAEDTLCYRLPSEAVLPLLGRPAGLQYVARSMLGRPTPDSASPGANLDPGHQPVLRLVHDKPIISAPADHVREVARRMAEAGVGAALVRLPDGELGIVTDSDLRDRVVAGGLDVDSPVSEVMSAPVFTVTPDRFGSEVMLEMLDRDVHHVPVVWPHGEVVGVLSDRDFVIAETRTPFTLRREIEDTSSPEELRRAAGRLRPAVIALHDADVPPAQVASIIAVIADAITRRLVEFAVADLGAPPCPLNWLALGSLGRREVVPSSDVDSALVWDGDEDDPQLRSYMRTLGERVVSGLAENGFVADAHGATAAESLFDRTFDGWRKTIRHAIAHPDHGKALIFISLLADARPVYEIGDARDPLDELGQVWNRRPLLKLLLRLALAEKPPTGLRRFLKPEGDVPTERSSEHRGQLDIKHSGLQPIVGIARYASLAAGFRITSTRARLRSASIAGTLDTADALALGEAFDLFWRLRLDHQVEQLRRGLTPDDFIDAETLDPLARRYMRDAFHAVAAVQRKLRGELELPP
jgi:CBS domain-containing protein